MINRNIYAHTVNDWHWPAYISVNYPFGSTSRDAIEVTVRSAASEDGRCGQTAIVALTIEQARELGHRLIRATEPAPRRCDVGSDGLPCPCRQCVAYVKHMERYGHNVT